MRIVSLLLTTQILLAAGAHAGPPQIDNSQLESTNLQGSLDSWAETWSEEVREPRWLGWHVPMADRDQFLCCGSRGDGRWQGAPCKLEGSHRHFVFSSDRPRTVMESDSLVVLLRADSGRLAEIQVYSDGCRLDAGGREVTWLEGVGPEASATLLGHLAVSNSAVEKEALMALALHATPGAAERLIKIARHGTDADLRGAALFWLSHTGAAAAADVILQALAEDPDAEVRTEAVFALSLLPDQQGMPLLLKILQDRSRSAEVREEAFFWYVQSGDDQALDLIAEILRR